jgi:hypothetical protein
MNNLNNCKSALVVEDNHVNQLVLKALLTKKGIEVSIAENGLKALEFAKEKAFSVILMDIHMPIMDGYEVTQRIRLLERSLGRKRTPIIAVTANAMKGDREKCIKAGMDDYVPKPVNSSLLLEKIERLTELNLGAA